MIHLRTAWRLWRALAHVLGGLWLVYRRWPELTPLEREQCVRDWSCQLLARIHIQLEVVGPRHIGGPLLLVANHISWLDITVLHATRFCRFVAKAQLRRWPILGTLASAIGTLYIERESRRDAQRVVHHMAESLRRGDVLAVFPEGTTSDGQSLLPFHANLLQAAISTNVPIQPVAIEFFDRATGQFSAAAAYVGDDSLLGSLWRTLSAPALTVRVSFGATQSANGRDRRTWAKALRDDIAALRKG